MHWHIQSANGLSEAWPKQWLWISPHITSMYKSLIIPLNQLGLTYLGEWYVCAHHIPLAVCILHHAAYCPGPVATPVSLHSLTSVVPLLIPARCGRKSMLASVREQDLKKGRPLMSLEKCAALKRSSVTYRYNLCFWMTANYELGTRGHCEFGLFPCQFKGKKYHRPVNALRWR